MGATSDAGAQGHGQSGHCLPQLRREHRLSFILLASLLPDHSALPVSSSQFSLTDMGDGVVGRIQYNKSDKSILSETRCPG